MSRQAAKELVDALEAWIACSNPSHPHQRTRDEIEQFRVAFAREVGGVPAETVRGTGVVELLYGCNFDPLGVVEQDNAFFRFMRALVAAAESPRLGAGVDQILGLISQARLVSHTLHLHIDLPTLAPPRESYLEFGAHAQIVKCVDRLHAEALSIARAMLESVE